MYKVFVDGVELGAFKTWDDVITWWCCTEHDEALVQDHRSRGFVSGEARFRTWKFQGNDGEPTYLGGQPFAAV